MNFKLIRNLWLLTGLFTLASLIINLTGNMSILLIAYGITLVLVLTCAYIYHRKGIKDNTEEKKSK